MIFVGDALLVVSFLKIEVLMSDAGMGVILLIRVSEEGP
jgi:hypothetical protein